MSLPAQLSSRGSPIRTNPVAPETETLPLMVDPQRAKKPPLDADDEPWTVELVRRTLVPGATVRFPGIVAPVKHQVPPEATTLPGCAPLTVRLHVAAAGVTAADAAVARSTGAMTWAEATTTAAATSGALRPLIPLPTAHPQAVEDMGAKRACPVCVERTLAPMCAMSKGAAHKGRKGRPNDQFVLRNQWSSSRIDHLGRGCVKLLVAPHCGIDAARCQAVAEAVAA